VRAGLLGDGVAALFDLFARPPPDPRWRRGYAPRRRPVLRCATGDGEDADGDPAACAAAANAQARGLDARELGAGAAAAVTPPRSKRLLAPGGLLRRPAPMELLEMGDIADPVPASAPRGGGGAPT
jgi:hypothetical protein